MTAHGSSNEEKGHWVDRGNGSASTSGRCGLSIKGGHFKLMRFTRGSTVVLYILQILTCLGWLICIVGGTGILLQGSGLLHHAWLHAGRLQRALSMGSTWCGERE